MKELIDKAEVVAVIKSLMCTTFTNFDEGVNAAAKTLLETIDNLEVKAAGSKTKIKGYVARDKDGDVYFGTDKPNWWEIFEIWSDFGNSIQLPSDWFPELKYTDEPVKAELMLVQPYMKKDANIPGEELANLLEDEE